MERVVVLFGLVWIGFEIKNMAADVTIKIWQMYIMTFILFCLSIFIEYFVFGNKIFLSDNKHSKRKQDIFQLFMFRYAF